MTNLFSLIEGNLPVFKYNLAFYLLAGFTIVSTVLSRTLLLRTCLRVRRVDAVDGCGAAAPLARQRAARARAARRVDQVRLLAATLAYFVVTSDMRIYRYVEPFWMFGMFATPPLWLGLGLLLAATVFVRNLYCRFLCPVGATLGLLSKL